MRCRWSLAVVASALSLTLLGGARQAQAAKKLKDCPIYKALTSQRRQGDQGRSAYRYRTTRRQNLSTAGHITNGVKNVLISPLEIPLTMRRVAVEQNIFAGLLGGTIEGVGNGLERMFTGAAEVVAAPIPGVRAPVYRRRLGARSRGTDPLASDIFANIIDAR